MVEEIIVIYSSPQSTPSCFVHCEFFERSSADGEVSKGYPYVWIPYGIGFVSQERRRVEGRGRVGGWISICGVCMQANN